MDLLTLCFVYSSAYVMLCPWHDIESAIKIVFNFMPKLRDTIWREINIIGGPYCRIYVDFIWITFNGVRPPIAKLHYAIRAGNCRRS